MGGFWLCGFIRLEKKRGRCGSDGDRHYEKAWSGRLRCVKTLVMVVGVLSRRRPYRTDTLVGKWNGESRCSVFLSCDVVGGDPSGRGDLIVLSTLVYIRMSIAVLVLSIAGRKSSPGQAFSCFSS